MLKASLTALSAVALLTAGVARAQSVPYTFVTQNGFVSAAQLDANFNYLLGNNVVHTATNVTLRNLSTLLIPAVARDGFYAAGDAPPVVYVASNSPCSLNAGAGDNGSQVQSINGKCWLANFPASGADIREWGAKSSSNGSVDSGDAIRAAYAWSASTGAPAIVPHGMFWLNTPDPSGWGAIVINRSGALTNSFPTPSGQFIGQNSPNHPDSPNPGTTPWFYLGSSLNVPLVFVRKNSAPVLWTDLFLSGNRGAEAGCTTPTGSPTPPNWCPGNKLYVLVEEDDGAATFGDTSIRFERTVLRDGFNGNLYQGSGRGGLWLRDVWSQYSGQPAAASTEFSLYLNAYDGLLDNVQVGGNAGSGLLLNEGSQYQIANGAFFLNGTSGVGAGMVVNGSNVNYLTVDGTNFQNNQCNGIKVLNANPPVGQTGGAHTYVNISFDGNSAGTTNTCSDFFADHSKVEVLVAPNFIGNTVVGGTVPKYAIEANSAQIRLFGPPLPVNSSGTVINGWGTSFTNCLFCLSSSGVFGIDVEQAWTPVLSTDGTPGTPTYVLQVGTYSRNNNEVTVHGALQISGWSGPPTGNVAITGLPFQASANANEISPCTVMPVQGWTAASFPLLEGFVGNSTSTLFLWEAGSGQTARQMPIGDVTTSTFHIAFTCVYHSVG